jgi:hypothetical protein
MMAYHSQFSLTSVSIMIGAWLCSYFQPCTTQTKAFPRRLMGALYALRRADAF